MFLAILAASLAWFVAAAILFFNPVVDRMYAADEKHPSVKALPPSPGTIGKILLAIVIQVVLWAYVYIYIQSVLPADKLHKGLIFGLILGVMKMIPRDIDRILLTTYPSSRMSIEFFIGIVCALVVGCTFSYML